MYCKYKIDRRCEEVEQEELQRLRAKNEILTMQRDEAKALARELSNEGGAEIDSLRAEVEALREAITGLLAAHARNVLFDGSGHWEVARTALREGEK